MSSWAVIEEKLVEWLQEKVSQAGAQGVVFGLSGGLDSAVVGALCKKAYPQNTLALIMPCFSQAEDVEHARLVAAHFSIPAKVVELDQAYQVMLSSLEEHIDGEGQGLSRANLKPRLRMTTLYFFAAHYNYLVIGTSNRSELAVGYFTKYGDGGVDLLPLGNLVKRQVRALAVQLGVPDQIISKPPSGGLWPGQTDEGEMGLTYQELDAYLLGDGVAPRVQELIGRMEGNSRHKRSLPPIPQLNI